MPKDKEKTNNIFKAVGRRKEAVARVMLQKGKGQFMINGRLADQYFPNGKIILERPFKITNTADLYFATVKVEGSGKAGQLDAVVHGIARALTLAQPETRTALKKAGLLTRDPRVKERRKYGRAQKARKGKQSPKR